jgi:DNA primase
MDFKVPEATIENFVLSNFKETKPTVSGELHFNSPFEKDGKLRLYVSKEKSSYFDQKSQTGGSFVSFVSKYLGISLRDAAITLIKDYSYKTDEEYKSIVEVHKDIELPNGLKFFFESDPSSRTYKIAKKYLDNRCIPTDDLGYVYDPKGDPKESYHNRIFIPFYEEGRLVYFIARTFEKDNEFRYKNPSGIDAGKFVFQIDKLLDDIFIFEGVFDALSLHAPQIGTAMLSNKLKQIQITKILDLAPKRIIFITENDKNDAAIRAGRINLEWNLKTMMKYKPSSLNIEFFIYNPPIEYKDFNEMSYKTGKHYIDIENECMPWKMKTFDVNNLQWGGRNAKVYC